MNKYISSTLRYLSCLLETVWPGLTSIIFGQATGFVTHVVTLAKYIYKGLMANRTKMYGERKIVV